MSTPGSIGSAMERLVDEASGLVIQFAADVADRPAGEGGQCPLHLGVELAQDRILDFVFALDLAHDQLGIADQLDLARPQHRRPLAPEQPRPVLAGVVGAVADPRSPLLETAAGGILDDRGNRRRAGVTPGAAVDVDYDLLQGQRSGWRCGRRAGGSPSRSWPRATTAAFPWRGVGSSMPLCLSPPRARNGGGCCV